MGTIVTLHPNSTVSNSGFVVVGASAHAALADPSGANHVTASGSVDDALRLGLESYTLQPNERVRQIRAILNVAKTTGRTEGTVDYGTGAFRSVNSTATGVLTLTGSYQTPWVGQPSDSLDQAAIDALELLMECDFSSGGEYAQFYEARVQLDIWKEPTATFSPTTYANDRDPLSLLPWTWDGGGEAQYKYQMLVFTAAQVAGVGFDPDVDVPVWDSGIVQSSNAWALPVGLAYGTEYVAFLKLAKSWSWPTILVPEWWTAAWIQSPNFFTIELPEADTIAPTSMALTTNKPLVTWNFTPESALSPTATADPAPAQWQVRVFKIPGGGWGGFDPDTNTADLIEDSGIVAGSAESYQTTVALANTTEHRAYVKLWRTSGSFSPHVSGPWAFSTFATDFIAPATPSLSTVIAVNAVDIAVTVTPGLKNLINANQSSLESNVFGYVPTVTAGAGTASVFQEATIAAHGTKSLGVDGTGAAGARTIETEMSAEVPCTAGLPYTAQCVTRKVVGQPARQVRIGLRWYAAGDVLISTSWGAASAATDAFVIRSVTATAPPTAVEMAIVLEIVNVDLPPEHHYFDKLMIQQASVVNTWFSGGTPDEQYYIIERRIAGGEWEFFSIAGGVTTENYVPSLEPFTVNDREGCYGKLHEYRAAAVGTALGIQTQSAWSALDSETLTIPRKVWIKDLWDPTLNRTVYVRDDWLTRTAGKARSVVRAIGRSKPVVVRGQFRADSFSITFTVLGQAMYDGLMALIESDRTLLLQTPKGNWYAEVSGDLSVQDHLWDDPVNEEPAWLVTVPFQEVDA